MSTPLFPDPPPPPRDAPLAERMRPRSLEQILGQRQLLGDGGFLHRALTARRLPSLLLWGPPGSGKTTLARLLAARTGANFFQLSAVSSGVKEVREVIARAAELRQRGQRSVLFIDEIHRFNRGQQDALLPYVEDGTVVLIGATTENPAHSVVAPLISRCRVVVLEPHSKEDLVTLVQRALSDEEFGLGSLGLRASADTLLALAEEADGDARRALTTLEIAATLVSGDELTIDDVRRAAQARLLRSDRQGDTHYDLASAFIKSLRGSDPDAAVYYLMRMIETGEDPLFPARRMLIFAAEDVGLADPHALPLALAASQSFERLGLPEGTLVLCEAALYLATAPKSNSVIVARDRAVEAVRRHGTAAIPDALRDGTAALSKSLGLGVGYRYPHDEPGAHAPVPYLPSPLQGEEFYEPSEQGAELSIAERLTRWRAAVRKARQE